VRTQSDQKPPPIDKSSAPTSPSVAPSHGAEPTLAGDPAGSVRVLQESRDPLATVLVTWSEGQLELDPLHPGGGLLIKMLAALEVPLDRFRIVALDVDGPVEAWAGACVPNRPVFCLADQSLASPGQQIVMLPSLERMLREQAPAKRLAWAALQPWIGLGGSAPGR
jgi:hypothetical protein